MKVTAKLAYSQIKVNGSRSFWALVAIALSTALTTAVCSFVAGGNGLLVDFLGPDYGEYRGRYIALLLIPAILFGMIILGMSIVVVSNVFRISAGERTAQFGIMKCVGATEKQITSTVIYEGVFLSAVGIPVGMAVGLGLTYLGTGVVNQYLSDLNSLAHIMINEINLSLDFVISWQALAISGVICFLTVMFSAWRPAHKAAKASAAASIRGEGTVKIESKKLRSNPLIQKFFGFEGALAAKNIKRNGRNFRATVIALSAGVILFVGLGSLSGQAKALEAYMRPDRDETIICEYSSARGRQLNEKTGRVESIFFRPFDSSMGDAIREKLEAFDGKEAFGVGSDMETYYGILGEQYLTEDMRAQLRSTEGLAYSPNRGYELSTEIITLDEKNYKRLCEKAGVPEGSNILINNYRYNNKGDLTELVPYLSELKSVELMKADGSLKALEIQGMIGREDIPSELVYPNEKFIRLVVPAAQVRSYSWYSDPSDEKGFIDYANGVMAEFFPEKEGGGYMEEGFSTRVYKIDDYMKVMNMAIVVASIFMYSFAALLMVIGFTNVISTMSTNVLLRAREFAVLQSVGMTPEGLRKMLTLESVLCSLKALLIGLPIGIAMTYLVNFPIRATYPIPYEVPWVWVLACTGAVFIITWATTALAAAKLSRQNLIEAIRSEGGK